MPRAAISVFVLDSGIREPDVPVVVRQLVFPRPPRDLVGLAVRATVAVLLAAIALVEESLIVTLEFVVEDDAPHPAALASKALLGALVGAIDGRIVHQLARLSDASVKGLAGLVAAVIALVAIGLEDIAPAVGQGHGPVVGTERRRANQSFALEMFEAPSRPLGVTKVVKISFDNNAKGTDGRQRAALSAVDLVDPIALADRSTLASAREVEIVEIFGEHVPWDMFVVAIPIT
jgi:hypothetical protein